MTNLTNNKAVLSWIDEMTAITKPEKIVWITGEEEQLGALREQAVKEGILIKGSNYLETLSQVKTVVFDKTGTLTKGVFEVTAVHHSDMDEQKLLEYAALAECASSHPISKSLQKACGGELDRAVKSLPRARFADGEHSLALELVAHLVEIIVLHKEQHTRRAPGEVEGKLRAEFIGQRRIYYYYICFVGNKHTLCLACTGGSQYR